MSTPPIRIRSTRSTCTHAALAGAALLATGALLGGCAAGEEVTISDDEYAGRAQQPTQDPGATQAAPEPSAASSLAGGPYADGTYTASETYGVVDDLVEQDSLDVTVTLTDGVVTDLEVVGHPFAERSREYMQDFVDEVGDVVVGRSLEDAQVTALAGASKTSDAFNEALADVAAQAAEAARAAQEASAAPQG